MVSELVPSSALSFAFAPASSSTLAVAMWPARTANINGVSASMRPLTGGIGPRDFDAMLAPASISAATASVLPSSAAHISAFWPRVLSTASTSAPYASSRRTASTLPVRAAVISAVSPPRCELFGSAPALSSRLMIGALPLIHASASGATP